MAMNELNIPDKAGQDSTNLALQQIAATLGVTTDALASAVNLANTAGNNANAKILDLETRWNDLTTKQQQDAEVIDARKGKASLKAKIDELETQSNENATQIINIKKKPNEVNIDSILVNGWGGALRYTKNDLGQVYLYGNITVGVIDRGTIVFTLPSDIRPSSHTEVLGMATAGGDTSGTPVTGINISGSNGRAIVYNLEGATTGIYIRFSAYYQAR